MNQHRQRDDTGTLLIWRGLDAWRSEVATVRMDDESIVADGTQVAVDPLPYRLDYRLEAGPGFITNTLTVEAGGTGWWRRLDLRHDGAGGWTQQTETRGRDPELGAPGGDMAAIDGALDCDLGLSPLTNVMPILRSGLNARPGSEDFQMAWVSVPDLGVVCSGQRYEHVRTDPDGGAIVRYVDRGLYPGFVAELQLDPRGLVVVYPGLAERVGVSTGIAGAS